jgi:hypothetical protein
MASFKEFIEETYPNGSFVPDSVTSGGYQYEGFRFSSPVKVKLNPSAENAIESDLLTLYIFPADNEKTFLVLLETEDSSNVKFEGELSEIKMKEIIKVFTKLLSQKSYITEKTLSELGIKKLETAVVDESNLPLE